MQPPMSRIYWESRVLDESEVEFVRVTAEKSGRSYQEVRREYVEIEQLRRLDAFESDSIQ